MPVKKSTIQRFKQFRSVAKPEFKHLIDQVINLYEKRNIGKEKEAENLLRKIVGPKPHLVPEKLSKYTGRAPETGKLSRPSAKTLSKQTKKFFISGNVKTTQKWIETRRGKTTNKTMTSKTNHPCAQTIEAKNEEEAR